MRYYFLQRSHSFVTNSPIPWGKIQESSLHRGPIDGFRVTELGGWFL